MGVATALPVQHVLVEPGEDATSSLVIRNTGQVIDQFTVDVLGDSRAWVQVTPDVVNLMPGADADLTIRFAPPRSPEVPAGVVPFGVRVLSREDPSGSAVVEGSVEVAPFAQTDVELVPRSSRGRWQAKHQLAIDNNGNQPTTVEVAAHDDEDMLDFGLDHRVATIAPGTGAFIKIKAKPEKRFLKGADRQHPFTVTVTPTSAPPTSTKGTVIQRQLMPAWLLPAVAVLAAACVAMTVLYLAVLKPSLKSTAKDVAQKAAAGEQKKVSAAASSAASKADAAQSAAAAAQKAVASGGGGKKPPAPAPTSPPVKAGSGANAVDLTGGTAIDFTLVADAAPTKDPRVFSFVTQSPPLPKGKVLIVSTIIAQNPNADQGTLIVRHGATGFVIRENMNNFRDQDFHFDDQPIVFTPDAPVQLAVNCKSTTTTRCQPSVLLVGRIISKSGA